MMLLHQLDVLGRLVARAAVGCVALNNGAVDGVDDGLHKLGVQVVLVAVLAAMDLDGHLAGQLDAQLAVHLHNGFGGEFVGEIDSRVSHNRGPPYYVKKQECRGRACPARGFAAVPLLRFAL